MTTWRNRITLFSQLQRQILPPGSPLHQTTAPYSEFCGTAALTKLLG
jgi:hypothetical protein